MDIRTKLFLYTRNPSSQSVFFQLILAVVNQCFLGTETFFFLPAVIKKQEEKEEKRQDEPADLELTKKIKQETYSQEH